jgi:hypothetical protein
MSTVKMIEDITAFFDNPEQDHLFDESLCILRKGKHRDLTKKEEDDLKKMLRRLHEKGVLTDEVFTKTEIPELYKYVKKHNNTSWLKPVKKKKPKKVMSKKVFNKLTVLVDFYGKIHK